LATDQRLDGLPEERRSDDCVCQPREAVERDLRAPGRGQLRRERAAKLAVVALEIAVEQRRRRQLLREKRLIDAVAGKRVDEPSCVAEERDPPFRQSRARVHEGQAAAADLLQARLRDPVLAAEAQQVLPEPWAFPLPATDADVDVVALRKDPAVAARDVRQLEAEQPAVLGF